MKTNAKHNLTRRTFLRNTLCATGAASVFPAIIPASARGKDGAVAPSNRITMGYIGCGGRMHSIIGSGFAPHKDIQSLAVCDVWRDFREKYGDDLGLKLKDIYNDFRELIARSDIDAVAIATPDHWHVPMAIAAMESGKDVYCEKPLSNTIREGRALVACAKRNNAVFQHGTQLHSLPAVRKACELVRNERIGKLHTIVIGSPPGETSGIEADMPIPDGLDYDLWLGPAPEKPYTWKRVFRDGQAGWYFISDYSKSGWIAGFGVHDLDIAQWGMGNNQTGPVSIEGSGVYPESGLYDTILTYKIEFEYANGVKLIMTDTGQNPHGVKFIGDDGWVFTRSDIEASDKSLLKEKIGAGGIHLEESPGHTRNFIECVKSRKETITPAEVAHRATSTALLGGIACQLERKLNWNPDTETFVNDSEADQLLSCPMRAPWSVY